MSFTKAFAIAVLGASVLAAPAFAKNPNGGSHGANSGFAGSKSVQTRPTPLPPRTTRQNINVINHKVFRCYHTRGRNEFGMPVPRTYCG
jgi:hypothetical protein